MQRLCRWLIIVLAVAQAGCASSVAEQNARRDLCLADGFYSYDTGNPETLSPLARSVFRASRLSVDQFTPIVGGAVNPGNREAYLEDIRQRVIAPVSDTEQEIQLMARFDRHEFRGISDRSLVEGIGYDTSGFLWHRGPDMLPRHEETTLTFVVEVNDKKKAEELVRQAARELKTVMRPADCWKYQDKEFLVDRRKGWAKKQREAGNERLARKQERELQSLLAGNYLDVIRIQYLWAPQGEAGTQTKHHIQTIALTYVDEDIRVIVRDRRPRSRG